MIGARIHSRGSFLVNVNNNRVQNLRKGLESCVISTIPRFVFQEEKQEVEQCHGLECVICLSAFEDGQVGRRLPSCNHAFHVECIDMWLHTHTTCPMCRASAVQVSSLLPEDGVGPQESAQRSSDLREMSGEVSNRLEVIVEVPSIENQ
ncbi:RING-H2 finger protein ATL63-like [Henckelia pumila]|uniref:RING-H2 finger protein ATL63-like n=1 Tax=Henckelia pumila TaxID=405737 RepID=UPI003C6DFC7D